MWKLAVRRTVPPLLVALACCAPPAVATPSPLQEHLPAVALGDVGPGGLVAAGRPEGGWLVVGVDEAALRLRAIRVAPDGSRAGTVTTGLFHEIEIQAQGLAVAPGGRWAAVWSEDAGPGGERVQGGLFEPDGRLVRGLDLTIPDPEFLPLVFPTARVVALPGGGFVVVWGAPTTATGNTGLDVFAARFSAAGDRVAGPVRLNAVRRGRRDRLALGVTETTVVAAWVAGPSERDPAEPRGVRARVLRHDLAPLGAEIGVAAVPAAGPFVGGLALAAAPAGPFVVAWQVARAPAAGGPFLRLRPFGAGGAPAGSVRTVATGVATEPELAGAATPAGVAWLTWIGSSGEVLARPFIPDGSPLDAARPVGITAPAAALSHALAAASDPAGRLLVALFSFGSGGPVVATVLGGQAPPPEEALTSPEVPGFRVWVLINGGTPGERWGSAEPACLAETLCASGAVPGRVEVLVRVVGPKPNGFLWPTLVKLSTSRFEVWIEQVGTGVLRYYLLPGATPGVDTLPGLFDRDGFTPL